MHEETPTSPPHDTAVQKATSDNENVDAVSFKASIITTVIFSHP